MTRLHSFQLHILHGDDNRSVSHKVQVEVIPNNIELTVKVN